MGYLLGNCWRGGAPDAMNAALAALSAGEWSADLATNGYPRERVRADPDFGSYYAPDDAATFSCNDDFPFSYSSGDWDDTRKRYWAPGIGGHSDFWGSTAAYFDTATLAWVLTDESCKYATTEDATLPFQTTDATWKTRRNPSGRFAPSSAHTAGGIVMCAEIDLVWVKGASCFGNGNGLPGGAHAVDATNGQWASDGYAWPYNSNGLPEGLLYANVFWVADADINGTPGGRVVLIENDHGGSLFGAWLCDPVNKSATKVAKWGTAAPPAANTCGCLIPDPNNAGRLAYVAYRDSTTIAYFPKVDQLPADAANEILSLDYGNTKPAAIDNAATWIAMWPYVTGSTKIAVFQPTQNGDGTAALSLYTLDYSTWNWSTEIAMTGAPAITQTGSGDLQRFKRLFFMDHYQAFGLIHDRTPKVHVLKPPAELLAA